MNYTQFKQLQNINEADLTKETYKIIVTELIHLVKTKGKRGVLKQADNGDLESLFASFEHGFTKCILTVITTIFLCIGILLHFVVRFIKAIVRHNDIYSIIVYPFAFIFDLINKFQSWGHLYNSEYFIMSDNEKNEYILRFQAVDTQAIWYTFWR